AGDLPPRLGGRVTVADPEVRSEELKDRQVGKRFAVRRAVRFEDGHAALAAALDELQAEPALPAPRLAHAAGDLSFSADPALKDFAKHPDLAGAPDESRETARAGDVEARAEAAYSGELEDADRVGNSLDGRFAEVP